MPSGSRTFARSSSSSDRPSRLPSASARRSKVVDAYRKADPGGVSWGMASAWRSSSARSPPRTSTPSTSASPRPVVCVSTCHVENGRSPGRSRPGSQPAIGSVRSTRPGLDLVQDRGRHHRLGHRGEEADRVDAHPGTVERAERFEPDHAARRWPRRPSRTARCRPPPAPAASANAGSSARDVSRLAGCAGIGATIAAGAPENLPASRRRIQGRRPLGPTGPTGSASRSTPAPTLENPNAHPSTPRRRRPAGRRHDRSPHRRSRRSPGTSSRRAAAPAPPTGS